VQIHCLNIKIFYKKKNKPSSKSLASTQIQSQEIIEKLMRKQKSKHKETGQQMQGTADISYEIYLVVYEEPKKNNLRKL